LESVGDSHEAINAIVLDKRGKPNARVRKMDPSHPHITAFSTSGREFDSLPSSFLFPLGFSPYISGSNWPQRERQHKFLENLLIRVFLNNTFQFCTLFTWNFPF